MKKRATAQAMMSCCGSFFFAAYLSKRPVSLPNSASFHPCDSSHRIAAVQFQECKCASHVS